MRLLLRLLAPIAGLSVMPWMLIGLGYTSATLTTHPWFSALIGLMVALSIFVLAYVARDEGVSQASDLAEALAASAAANYDTAIKPEGEMSPGGLFEQVETMRKELRAQKKQAVASLAAEQEAAKLRKEEEERLAHGYVEAHEEFMRVFCDALTVLANGDLTVRLETPFAREYEKLRECYNQSIDRLNKAFGETVESVQRLGSSTDQISTASGALSERTSQQAASLEETSAALRQVTTTVAKTSDNAQHASALVSDIRANAQASSQVVREAIGAMQRIEKSSEEIEQIIGVIDEIAFQTNLLALNAGVEAARAGEAGRGFAVVASEVRALAQRSAEPAKGIKSLIAGSTSQVRDGVRLVSQTGEALVRIASQVAGANDVVAEIADGAREQSSALLEVNSALAEMDKFTQENAAMVEETTVATRSLEGEIHGVLQAVSALVLVKDMRGPVRQPAERRVAAVRRGAPPPSLAATAQKFETVPDAHNWEEF